MRLLLLIILTCVVFKLNAQIEIDYFQTDSIILNIPDKWTTSTQKLADYINAEFTEETEKARAIFTWVASNIEYDVENMFVVSFYQEERELIEEVMQTRKGICGHFAELFNDVANQAGLKSYSITGYTKQAGLVDYLSHGWCATRVDSIWYLFDPTWGAGVLVDAHFVNRLNDRYFMMTPDTAIISHMPFDPLWQFLNYPITSAEFYEDSFAIDTSKAFFNFKDTLKLYEQQSEIEQLASSSKRIVQNGVKNSLTSDKLKYNKRALEHYRKQATIDQYNEAVDAYNEGIYGLNDFINYRNRQFTPKKTEAEIRQKLEKINTTLTIAKAKLEHLENPDADLAESTIQLKKAIDQAIKEQNVHQAFVDKYFKTKKMFRKSLFYKYTWMGIPLN